MDRGTKYQYKMLRSDTMLNFKYSQDNIETEYKFARAQLWADYIGDGVATLPPPLNLIPSPKSIVRWACKLTNRCFGVPKRLPCCTNEQFRVYHESNMDVEQKKQNYQSVVRELIRRYWARRRHQKTPSENVIPDHLGAMATVRDQVSDMLSEIRNILKTNKQRKDRERHQKSDEGHLQMGESSKTNGNHNHVQL